MLAVAVGALFWAWDLLWAAAFQAVPFPVSYALVGVWMIGGLLVPYVIRRPGAALLGELVAAFVSMVLINQWGAAVLLSGLVQGLGAELVFGARGWKDYRLPTVMLAGAVAGVFSILLDSVVYSYWSQYTRCGDPGRGGHRRRERSAARGAGLEGAGRRPAPHRGALGFGHLEGATSLRRPRGRAEPDLRRHRLGAGRRASPRPRSSSSRASRCGTTSDRASSSATST